MLHKKVFRVNPMPIHHIAERYSHSSPIDELEIQFIGTVYNAAIFSAQESRRAVICMLAMSPAEV